MNLIKILLNGSKKKVLQRSRKVFSVNQFGNCNKHFITKFWEAGLDKQMVDPFVYVTPVTELFSCLFFGLWDF